MYIRNDFQHVSLLGCFMRWAQYLRFKLIHKSAGVWCPKDFRRLVVISVSSSGLVLLDFYEEKRCNSFFWKNTTFRVFWFWSECEARNMSGYIFYNLSPCAHTMTTIFIVSKSHERYSFKIIRIHPDNFGYIKCMYCVHNKRKFIAINILERVKTEVVQVMDYFTSILNCLRKSERCERFLIWWKSNWPKLLSLSRTFWKFTTAISHADVTLHVRWYQSHQNP